MIFVRLLPGIFSLFLLSAHFSRLGISILSLILLLLPFLLFIKKKWVVSLFKFTLIVGALEWIRTLLFYINQRQEFGEPYLRLVIIIGVVALFTGLSALSFKNNKIKEIYNYRS